MRTASFLAIASLVCCGAPAQRLEGYEVILCSGARVYEQVGIDLEDREFGMSDFRSSFDYCSNDEYYCMRAPLLVSVPKEAREMGLNRTWEIEGIEFSYERHGSGFQIAALLPSDELLPGTRVTSVFSEDGDLIEVTHQPRDREVEVQRVCYGQVNLDQLFIPDTTRGS